MKCTHHQVLVMKKYYILFLLRLDSYRTEPHRFSLHPKMDIVLFYWFFWLKVPIRMCVVWMVLVRCGLQRKWDTITLFEFYWKMEHALMLFVVYVSLDHYNIRRNIAIFHFWNLSILGWSYTTIQGRTQRILCRRSRTTQTQTESVHIAGEWI